VSFEGTKVLITGGARGIGEATATAFRDKGAVVAIGGRTHEAFDGFCQRNGEQRVVPALGEVGTQAGAHDVVDRAVKALGGLDILVNSAGVFEEVPIEEVTQDHWDRTLSVNAGGTFFCSQAALTWLNASGGNIVNVASDAGLIGYPNGCVYSASKAAVVNMTRAMALELAGRVRINCVCPGNVDTDMIHRMAAQTPNAEQYLAKARRRAPLRRMARPQEVAGAILYLASAEAKFTHGAILSVDGGGVCGF